MTDIFDVHDYDQDPAALRARYERLVKENFLEEKPYIKGHEEYGNEPVFVSEYGGIGIHIEEATDEFRGKKAWCYGNACRSLEEFYERYKGLTDALLDNPRVYDAYFLDMPDETYSAYDLAKDIQAKGILSPIIFCNSTMDYRDCGNLLPNSVFINKPIIVSELSLILDEIIIQKQEQYIPTVELRNATEVFYLTEKEIVYCESPRGGRQLLLHLLDGSITEADGILLNFLTELVPFETFFMANKSTIINARYVKKADFFHIIMQNGESFRLAHSYTSLKEIRDKIEKIKSNS